MNRMILCPQRVELLAPDLCGHAPAWDECDRHVERVFPPRAGFQKGKLNTVAGTEGSARHGLSGQYGGNARGEQQAETEP